MCDWRHMPFGKALEKIVANYANNMALIYKNERLTYLEFKQKVDKLSKGLIYLGINKGDRVALWLPNYPEWIITQWSVAQIGSVLVSVNPRYRAYDLEHVLNNAEVSTLVLTDKFKSTNFIDILKEICPEISEHTARNINCNKVPSLKNIILVRAQDYKGYYSLEDIIKMGEMVDDAELQRRKNNTSADDMVYLLYTSGTTSIPKGAVRTHDNILQHSYDVGVYNDIQPEDKMLGVVPFCGAWGASTIIPGTLTHGACLVVQDDFDVEETLRLIQEEKITAMHGVDVMYRAMLDYPQRRNYDISSLKKGGVALFSSSTELMKEIIYDLGMTYAGQALGMTELNACWLLCRFDDPVDMRIKTIGGWGAPGLEAVVKDPNTGKILPRGEVGELCARGYTVLPEYYKSPEETKKVFDDEGWFHTGDLGVCDGDNHFCFKGRLKEMYKSQGFNVTPLEVEDFLQTHPKINATGVVGIADPVLGEAGMAFIEPIPGVVVNEQEVLDYCRGKIASYKIPKYVIIIDSLPRIQGPHGDKISKTGLMNLSQKELARLKQ